MGLNYARRDSYGGIIKLLSNTGLDQDYFDIIFKLTPVESFILIRPILHDCWEDRYLYEIIKAVSSLSPLTNILRAHTRPHSPQCISRKVFKWQTALINLAFCHPVTDWWWHYDDTFDIWTVKCHYKGLTKLARYILCAQQNLVKSWLDNWW